VDAVVFTVLNDSLKILLVQRKNNPFKNKFALPGGFVNADEELEDAVKRELEEETGVKDVFLKQLGTYGTIGRDPRGRVISNAFIALVNPNYELVASTDAKQAKWFDIDTLPNLAFDHRKIINDALDELKFEIQTTNIAFQILPKRFTLTQLQQLYETILDKELDKRNFRKRIRKLELLNKTNQYYQDGAHRPALLYYFKDKKYCSIKEKVHVFL